MKNIVLLSDGTGNSAARPFKTNVWRLYEAIDLGDGPGPGPTQLVHYDEGVGNGSLRPLALLGQAFGIGLAKNVRDLYEFLCRNYSPLDRIYLFGFSRGAFTIRLLTGLIAKCGLVTAQNDTELRERVELAYSEYKRDAARRASTTRLGLVAGHALRRWHQGPDDQIQFHFFQHFPRIAFVGVWDTVDAYGMPVDELKTAIDQYVWPMTLADRRLSNRIDCARHALSLDEERPAFKPVLWNDAFGERLKQVWFAGVHANVGGGYPDDGMAYVSLQWMMEEAIRAGLRFSQVSEEECRRRANAHATHEDSRAGIAGYYRYGPRDVAGLCNDLENRVTVKMPLIHKTVLNRVRQQQVRYAPVSVPARYLQYPPGKAEQVPSNIEEETLSFGRSVPEYDSPVETEEARSARGEEIEYVRDAIFRRRVAYFLTVVLTVVLASLPLMDWLASASVVPSISGWLDIDHLAQQVSGSGTWLVEPLYALRRITEWTSAVLSFLVAKQILPGWLSIWGQSFANHPLLFLSCGFAVLWLFVRTSEALEQQIFARSEYAWRHLIRPMPQIGEKPRPGRKLSDRAVRWLRTNPGIGSAAGFFWSRVVPLVLAVFVVAPVGALILPFFIPKFIRNAQRRRKYTVIDSPLPEPAGSLQKQPG